MEFIRYDWNNSVEWKNYLENIFPSPPQNRILHYKKKFYKLKIDPDFDINYIPGQNNNNENQNNNQRNNQNQNNENEMRNGNRNNNNNFNIDVDIMFIVIDMIISITSFLAFFIHLKTSINMLIGCLIYKLIKKEGKPKFEQQYLINIINNENFSYLILILLLFIDNSKNYFIAIPTIVYILIDIINNINLIYKNNIFSKILAKKQFILKYSNILEINIISPIYGFFMNKNSFYFIFFYIQYLKFRVYVNQNITNCLVQINNYLNNLKSSQNTPKILKNIVQFTQNLGNTIFNLPNNIAANTNIAICSIF
jgi:hypothetical protein